jgi:hypothetical protein
MPIMAKVRPVSQLPAISRVAKESERKTDRIPCVNHFSGKIAATCCIQRGRSVKIKKTPLKNCKMMTTGETIADAPRAFLGTLENATPRIVETTDPEISSAANISHLLTSVGKFTPKNATPATSRRNT